ncbi:MAG: radical SAM protein [Candidatus Omnitrophica bacterium]|nr:radical SAM protein [Candidatus Omnitrophota bacterium]
MDDPILKGILNGREAFIGPEIVQFDITNHCNNNCLCCWNNSPLLGVPDEEMRKELNNELPYELIIKTIDDLKAMGTKILFFAGGGEPFMHPRIMDILKYSKNAGMRVYLNSNFTLIDSQKAREVVEMKVDHIHVSILAATAATYVKVHPNKTENTFYTIKEMLKYIARLKAIKNQHLGGPDHPLGPLPHIGMHYVLFNANYHEIDAMVNLAIEVHADSVEFPLIDIVPGKTDTLLLGKDELNFVADELKQQVEKIDLYNPTVPVKLQIVNKELFEQRIYAVKASEGKYEDTVVTKQPCYVGWMFLRILANGNVNSCLKSHRMPVGNIYEHSIREIWDGDKQKEFREKALLHDPNDAYFNLIGNDPTCKFGCLDSCDNIKINIEMHQRYGKALKEHGKIT